MIRFPEFQRLPAFFDADQRAGLEQLYQQLHHDACDIVQQTRAEGSSLAARYRRQPGLIVVPEKGAPDRICRMEYLSGSSDAFYQQVTRPVQQRLEALLGAELALFKDKCNVKAPQGGAFPPHQDAPAYLHFGPSIFITAGIMLDDLSQENGCLHMATNYHQLQSGVRQRCTTAGGDYPLLEWYAGGARNGDIVDEAQRALAWETLTAQAGDVLLFNSFIPHFSHVNNSQQYRRVIYLTFNLLSEGDHYQRYYRKKWQDYDNPQFHISTPTTHAALADSAGSA